jgi:mono/diheme cytochrome c family protein
MRKLILALGAVGVAACLSFAQGTSEKKKTAAPKGDAAKGKEVFIDNCAQCHEAYSKEEKVGPGLQGIKDGKLPDGKPATHDKLLDIVNNGPAEMPSFEERLTEQEKEDVVAFVMSL